MNSGVTPCAPRRTVGSKDGAAEAGVAALVVGFRVATPAAMAVAWCRNSRRCGDAGVASDMIGSPREMTGDVGAGQDIGSVNPVASAKCGGLLRGKPKPQ